MSQLILVVDGDPDQRKLLERVLSGARTQSIPAADDEAGLVAGGGRAPGPASKMPTVLGSQVLRPARAAAAFPVTKPTPRTGPADRGRRGKSARIGVRTRERAVA